MPANQSAVVPVYEFSPGDDQDLAVRLDQGGRVGIMIENPTDDDAVVSVQVSADDASYAATTAAANENAITAVSVPARTRSASYDVLLRAGTDKYMRLTAASGSRLVAHVRDGGILEIQNKTGA